jgi:hypothetical protein
MGVARQIDDEGAFACVRIVTISLIGLGLWLANAYPHPLWLNHWGDKDRCCHIEHAMR